MTIIETITAQIREWYPNKHQFQIIAQGSSVIFVTNLQYQNKSYKSLSEADHYIAGANNHMTLYLIDGVISIFPYMDNSLKTGETAITIDLAEPESINKLKAAIDLWCDEIRLYEHYKKERQTIWTYREETSATKTNAQTN